MKSLITNGRVITPSGIANQPLLFENGRIVSLGNASDADEIIDAEGCYVCPGFIDIHTHGAGGADFMDGTVDAYITAARMQAVHGATLVFPTTLTSSNELLLESFETFRSALAVSSDGAQLGGMHLEGPYFNPIQAGAQDARYLHAPTDPSEYREIIRQGEGIIKRWSFSPELDGAPEFAAELSRSGIIASMGHTNATFEQCEQSFLSGALLLTHFYSCMSTITRKNGFRIGGVLEYGYYQDALKVEIIADGCHVPASLLKLVMKLKGADSISLVTDSTRGAGMPEGPSVLGSLKDGVPCIIEDGVAKMPDRTCFAGSVATTDRLVRTMINLAGCSVEDAVRMMTVNPARIMGVYDKKGSLEPGKDADIVICDDDIRIKRTIIKGKTVYKC